MGSIPQFRNIVKSIKHLTFYVGVDEEGDTIYDYSKTLPVIKAIGYEKLDGTQIGISFNNKDGFWIQSKNNIITPENDNYGCASSAHRNSNAWSVILHDLADEYSINLNKNTITVFAEWCGVGIQKNSAASGLEKRAVIFRYFKVTPDNLSTSRDFSNLNDEDDEIPAYWLKTAVGGKNVSSPENNIFNIADYPHVEIDIDFANPEKAQNKIMEIILKNEEHSPFGKAFGKESNILEGYVFNITYRGKLLRWKSKGEKHSKCKVKVQKKYTPEELANLNKAKRCAEEIFRFQRCNQALNEIFGPNDEDIDVKRIGEYLKWVSKDTIKEESDIIEEYGLVPKDVMKYVQDEAKKYFFGIINKLN